MDHIPVQNMSMKLDLAEFFPRVLGHLIDGVVAGVLVFITILLFVVVYPNPTYWNWIVMLSLMILSLIATFVNTVILPASKWQGSIGHMALDLKVVDVQGERVSIFRSFAREICKMLEIGTGLGLIISLLLFIKYQRTLFDTLTGTRVVKRRS